MLGMMSFLFDGTVLAGWPDGKGRGRDRRRRRREGVRVECKLQTGIPACTKLDLIHMMLVGHEGCSNNSLLGIWKMEKERMSEVQNHNATHLGAQWKKTNANHSEATKIVPYWELPSLWLEDLLTNLKASSLLWTWLSLMIDTDNKNNCS